MSLRVNRDASASWENELPLIQVTVLYENVESGLRAKALMEYAESGLDFPAEFRLEYWRFDWLNEALLGHMAGTTAKESALVIVAASSIGALPRQVEGWIQAWAQARGTLPSALIVLLPADPQDANSCESLRERLHGMAQNKEVDVFCESFGQSPSASGAPSDSVRSEGIEYLKRRPSRRRRVHRLCSGHNRFAKRTRPPDARD